MTIEQENYVASPENLDPTELLVALPSWTIEPYNLRRPDYRWWNLLPRDWIKEYPLKSPAEDGQPLLMKISKREFYLGLTVGGDKDSINLNDIRKIAVNSPLKLIIVTSPNTTCYVWNRGRTANVRVGKAENSHADIRINFS